MVDFGKRFQESPINLSEILELKGRDNSLNYKSRFSEFVTKAKSPLGKIKEPIKNASVALPLAAAEATKYDWTGWVGDFLKGFANGYLLGLPVWGKLANKDVPTYLAQYISNMTIAEDVGTVAGLVGLYTTYKGIRWGVEKYRSKHRVFT